MPNRMTNEFFNIYILTISYWLTIFHVFCNSCNIFYQDIVTCYYDFIRLFFFLFLLDQNWRLILGFFLLIHSRFGNFLLYNLFGFRFLILFINRFSFTILLFFFLYLPFQLCFYLFRALSYHFRYIRVWLFCKVFHVR